MKNPWALFIALGWKKIENRDWAPPASLLKVGEAFAIHAGAASHKRGDLEDLDELLRGELFDSLRSEHERLGLPITIRGWLDLWEAMPQGGWAEFPDAQQEAYDARGMQCFDFEIYPLEMKDKAGGDLTEWPEDLRIRTFPGGFPR